MSRPDSGRPAICPDMRRPSASAGTSTWARRIATFSPPTPWSGPGISGPGRGGSGNADRAEVALGALLRVVEGLKATRLKRWPPPGDPHNFLACLRYHIVLNIL